MKTAKEATTYIEREACRTRVINTDAREMALGDALSAGMILVRRIAELESELKRATRYPDSGLLDGAW